MDPDEFLPRALIRPQPRPQARRGMIRAYLADALGVLMLFALVVAVLVL